MKCVIIASNLTEIRYMYQQNTNAGHYFCSKLSYFVYIGSIYFTDYFVMRYVVSLYL
jgi:hypothetical protein